jgi:hypothetical protein
LTGTSDETEQYHSLTCDLGLRKGARNAEFPCFQGNNREYQGRDRFAADCFHRQLSEIFAITSRAALFCPHFRGFAGQTRPEPAQNAAEMGEMGRDSQSLISEVGKWFWGLSRERR